MRKLVWQILFSLDGLMAGSRGELDWHVLDDDFAQYVAEMPKRIDTMIFGRVTYEMMAAHWASDEPGRRLPEVTISRCTSPQKESRTSM